MMKLGTFLAAATLCLSATSAQASTILQPTDTNVNFFTYSSAYTIGVFDQLDTSFDTSLLVVTGPSLPGLYGGTVNFTPFPSSGSGPYFASNGVSTTLLALGSTNEFIVALSLDGGINWLADTGAQFSSNGDIASLSFAVEGQEVIAVDVVVSAVPVPAAVWLFGTGLIGLAGIARRRS